MAENSDAMPRWPGDGKDFRVTMGLHVCQPENWLLRGVAADELIANKAAILQRHHDAAFAVLPEGDAAARETAELISTDLFRFSNDCEGLDGPIFLGDSVDEQHPLERVSRAIAEDVCVLTPHVLAGADGSGEVEYRLTAAVLCAPSRWSLAEKLGTSLRDIHAPVPGYEAIAAPSDKFFSRLPVSDIMERTNWSVLHSPELFQPGTETQRQGDSSSADLANATRTTSDADASVSTVLSQRWLRLERQTLRKLPQSGAVVFTILTTNTRLDDLAATQPEVARQLAHKMRTAPAETREYKSWPDAESIALALEAACSAA